MNDFQYAIIMTKIETLKTFKAKEELTRELSAQLTRFGGYSLKVTTENHQSVINTYKALGRIIPLCTSSKGLPMFINESYNRATYGLLRSVTSESLWVTYDKYIDMFKYHEGELEFSGSTANDRAPFIRLIGDKLNPYDTRLRIYSTPMATSILGTRSNTKALLIDLELLKRDTLNDQYYTVLEEELNRLYTSNEQILPANTLEQMAGINAVIATIHNRINTKG